MYAVHRNYVIQIKAMDRKRMVDFVWYFVLCFIIYVLFSYTIYVILLLLLLYVTRQLLDREAVGSEIKDSAVLITGCDSGNMKYSIVHITLETIKI